MKKYLKLETLTQAEVPQELDLRILAAAKLRQNAWVRNRRVFRYVLSGTAAAAALLVAWGIHLMPQQQFKRIPNEDYAALLEMSDWSALEQENYNVSSELASSSSLLDLADNRTFSGGLK